MGKRRSEPTPEELAAALAAEQAEADGPDYSLVMPLSLLAGGLAAYPSLSAAAAGEGDFLSAITLFLGATLVATLGFGIVAFLIDLWSPDPEPDIDEEEHGAGRALVPALTDQSVTSTPDEEMADGPVPTVALNPQPDPRADAIDTALAPTDALVHDAN